MGRCAGLVHVAALAVGLAVGSPAFAATVGFDFVFDDPVGIGFRSAEQGAAARKDLRHAGRIWGSHLVASHPGETITVRANFGTPDLGGNALGGAVAAVTLAGGGTVPDTLYPAALANHLTHQDLILPGEPHFGVPGADVSKHGEEIFATFASGLDWNFSRAKKEAGPDFLSTAVHEIGHGLGFLSSLQADGTYDVLPLVYDRFLVDDAGRPLADMTTSERQAAASKAGHIFWSGAAGTAANGGKPVPLLASDKGIVQGVTLVHTLFGIMGSDVGAMRTIDAAAIGMVRDLGWSVSASPAPIAVPAPVLLLGSAVGALAVLRRRRHAGADA